MNKATSFIYLLIITIIGFVPQICFAWNINSEFPQLSIELPGIIPDHIKEEYSSPEHPVMLQIKDGNSVVIYSQVLNNLNRQVTIHEHSTYLLPGNRYSISIHSLHENKNIYQGEYFTYWPDCEEVKNPQISVGDGKVSISWDKQEHDDYNSYIVKVTDEAGNIFNEYTFDGNTNQYTLDDNEQLLASQNIYIKRVCHYSNGVTLQSDWILISGNHVEDQRSIDCYLVQNYSFSIDISATTETSIKVDVTPSPPSGVYYKLYYKIAGTESWEYLHVPTNPTSITIEDLSPATEYNIVVYVTVGPNRFDAQSCELLQTIQNHSTLGPEAWADVYCGADDAYSENQNNNPVDPMVMEPGVILIAGGFPLVVDDISNNGNNLYSGRAEIKLPFNGKRLIVDFTEVFVNTEFIIKSGTISAVDNLERKTRLQNLLNYGGGSPPGELSCTPPVKDPKEFGPNGLNSLGFDEDGKYGKEPPYEDYEEGDPFDENYDPNGFGADGDHKDTGEKYDENGCDQLGLDANGNPCEPWPHNPPYYWMNDNPNATEEGKQFWKDNWNNINLSIKEAINAIYIDIQGKINAQQALCNVTRGEIDGIVASKQLNRTFLFGENEEYFVEGMHKNFIAPPLKFSNFSGRDDQIIELEKLHVNLYNCDKILFVYLDVIDKIKGYKLNEADEPPPAFALNSESIEMFLNYLEPIIKGKSAETIEGWSNDNQAFLDWIHDELYNYIIKEYLEELNSIGHFSGRRNSIFQDIAPKLNAPDKKGSYLPFLNEVGCSVATETLGMVNLGVAEEILTEYMANLPGLSLKGKIHDLIEEELTSYISGDDELGQPVELSKTVLGQTLTIYLDNIRIIPMQSQALLDAFFILEVQSGKRIVFSVNDIPFTNGGLSGQIKMELESDIAFSLGKGMRLTFKGGAEPTYVMWSCSGFETISVKADLEFCREYVVPLDPTTLNVLNDGYVTASIDVTMDGWSDFLVGIDVTPFAVTDKEDYKFELTNVWLDFSDYRNPENIIYPIDYEHPNQTVPTWQGVYFQQLSVTFPSYISGEGNALKKLEVNNFIFDGYGASGAIYLEDVLDLEDGSIGGWAFSVDGFELIINRNRVTKGSMDGLVHIPILRKKNNSNAIQETDCFVYNANMDSNGDFMFEVIMQSDLVIPMFVADLTLDTNTTIYLFKQGNEFNITATLHGEVDIKFNKDNVNINTGVIVFNNLILSNRGDLIQNIGTWEFPKIPIEFLGFEINFLKIGLRNVENSTDKMELFVSTSIALTEGNAGFKVLFDFGIQGVAQINGKHVAFDYEQFNFYKAFIEGSCTGIKSIQGELIVFRGVQTYGTGWRGKVIVKFENIDFEAGAIAIFGKIDAPTPYKYFMVDVMVIFGTSVPLFPPINLEGIGGGFWYNMESENHDDVSLMQVDVPDTDDLEGLDLGLSLSGVNYTPSSGKIGFKVAAAFSIANPNAVCGNIAISIEFTKDFGIEKFRLDGAVRIMGEPEIGAPPAQGSGDPGNIAPIRAYFSMVMDFTEGGSFTSTFDAYLYVADVLKGGDEIIENYFGNVTMHFGKDNWYIWMGTPEKPLSIIVDIVDVGISTYLCLGNTMPAPPVLHGELATFFGVSPSFVLDHRMSSGAGFMHGAHISMGDNYKFWIFTLSAQFKLGYDMVLMQYEANCKLTNRRPGFDGWYAQGQMYVYLHVGVGYEVRILGKKRKGTIADVKAGMLMRASLPNPVYAQGTVAISYNILGIIKGKKKYTLTIGERCELVTEEGEEYNVEFKVIDGITPDNGAVNIPCNEAIVVNMTMPHMDELVVEEDVFQFKLNQVIFRKSDLRPVECYVSWSEDSLSYTLKPKNYLTGESSYEVEARASVLKNGVVSQSEQLTITFSTNACAQVIEPGNIAESYPHIGQHHFFIEETDAEHGYIKLESGQFYLFSQQPPNAENIVRVKEYGQDNVLFTGPVFYNCSKNQLNYEIPWNDFASSNTAYTVEIVRAIKIAPPTEEDPEEGGDDEDGFPPLGLGIQGESESENGRAIGSPPYVNGFPPGGPGPGFPLGPCVPQITTEPIEKEIVLLKFHFKTSSYPTAAAKWMDLVDISKQHIVVELAQEGRIQNVVLSGEGFDEYELTGVNGNPPFFNEFKIGDIYFDRFIVKDFFKLYSNPGKMDVCSGDELYTDLEFADVIDIYKHTFVLDTLYISPPGDNVFVQHFQQIRFKSFLPELLYKESLALKNLMIQRMKNSNYYDGNPCIGNPYDWTIESLITCFKREYTCEPKLDSFLDHILDDTLPYHFPFEGWTNLTVGYNSKPLTNKGMTPFSVIIPYSTN